MPAILRDRRIWGRVRACLPHEVATTLITASWRDRPGSVSCAVALHRLRGVVLVVSPASPRFFGRNNMFLWPHRNGKKGRKLAHAAVSCTCVFNTCCMSVLQARRVPSAGIHGVDGLRRLKQLWGCFVVSLGGYSPRLAF